ncbi:MAG: S8 family serine peptidase [Candidatus Zixiibacteriota bacterium]|nr:MAG: S8 family serine peptidase [candidate division Zixibacteria bacterium]
MWKKSTVLIGIVMLIVIAGASAADLYYYVYDKAVPVVYSEKSLAVRLEGKAIAWNQFFAEHKFLARVPGPAHLPNGMYKVSLAPDADISTAMALLQDAPGVSEVRRIWVHPTAGEIFPSHGVVALFKEAISADKVDSIVRANDIREYRWMGRPGHFCYFGFADGEYEKAVQLGNEIYESGLAEISCFDFAIEIKPLFTPDDPLYKYLWNLENDGSLGGTMDADIDMEEAWEYALPYHGDDYEELYQLQITILDDGVGDHEDLGFVSGRYYGPGVHWQTGDLNGFSPGPDQAHGQAIAGILKGINDNEKGVSGILRVNHPNIPDYDPFHLRCHVICDTVVWPVNVDYSRLQDAILHSDQWDFNSHVISISWRFAPEPAIATAIEWVYNLYGVLCVCAAGNRNCHLRDEDCGDDTLLAFPAEHPLTLAVGATDENDVKWNYSQWGEQLDVMAPSSDGWFDQIFYGAMVTIDQMYDYGYAQEWGVGYECFDTLINYNYFCHFGGTSAAAPQVAGIAMLLIARRPDLFLTLDGYCIPCAYNQDSCTAKLLRDIIRHSSEDIVNYDEQPGIEDTARINDRYGYGRANAARALLAVSRGDANNDGAINLLDITYIIAYLYKSGPPPHPSALLADADCDGKINILDITHIIEYVYKEPQGPPPPVCFKY